MLLRFNIYRLSRYFYAKKKMRVIHLHFVKKKKKKKRKKIYIYFSLSLLNNETRIAINFIFTLFFFFFLSNTPLIRRILLLTFELLLNARLNLFASLENLNFNLNRRQIVEGYVISITYN